MNREAQCQWIENIENNVNQAGLDIAYLPSKYHFRLPNQGVEWAEIAAQSQPLCVVQSPLTSEISSKPPPSKSGWRGSIWKLRRAARILGRRRYAQYGFTLPEMIAVVVIIGIMAAFVTPSVLSWLNNQRMSTSLAQVEGAFKEAQRESMRQNIVCTISFSPGLPSDNPTLSATPLSCLPTGSRTLGGKLLGFFEMGTINLRSTVTNFVITPRRGGSNTGALFLSIPDGGVQQSCLVVSSYSGLMRTGVYIGIDPTGTSTTDCVQP